MIEWLQFWLVRLGLSVDAAMMAARWGAVLIVLVLAAVAYRLFRSLGPRAVAKLATRTHNHWDDIFIEKRVLDRLAHLVPAAVIFILAPNTFAWNETLQFFIIKATSLYAVVAMTALVIALIRAALAIYNTFDLSRLRPLNAVAQILQLVTYLVATITIISIVFDRNPVFFLSGLGAFTAVLMLVFQDSILGFVAGLQLTSNRMIAVGDWIEMPKYNANGDVIEIALTTVKVQNWDKTITTIPTYALISDAFKNWRGMQESGGRRIMRALNIDMGTIRFCDEATLERFAKIQYISDYIEQKKGELAEYNNLNQVDLSMLANGRRLTNIGTFRAYVTAYLRHHPAIHQQMTFLIRQLAPTPQGLPIEIYVFTNNNAWAAYEAIQADIFDHILAVLPEFDLRVYQQPSGADLHTLWQHSVVTGTQSRHRPVQSSFGSETPASG